MPTYNMHKRVQEYNSTQTTERNENRNRLKVVELLSNLIEFLLRILPFFVSLLILLLPLIPFRFDGRNFSLIVFSFNIGKAKPTDKS
jgi:hypothetical protein